jgi:hypothetical protein
MSRVPNQSCQPTPVGGSVFFGRQRPGAAALTLKLVFTVHTKKLSLVLAVALLGLVSASGAPVSVHDWSLEGPGGRYGITETGYTVSETLKS